jgi:hypothetical protein
LPAGSSTRPWSRGYSRERRRSSAADVVPAWQIVTAAEPALAVELSPEPLDGALASVANFADLKSPFTPVIR